MKDLPPEAAALLARARAEHEPTSRDLATTLGKLHRSLEFGPGPVASTRSDSEFSTNTIARRGLLTTRAKVVLLTVVVGGLVAARLPSLRPRAERASTAPLVVSPAASVDSPALPPGPGATQVLGEDSQLALRSATSTLTSPTARASRHKTASSARDAVSPPPTRERARAVVGGSSNAHTGASSTLRVTPSPAGDDARAARIELDRSSRDELDPPMPGELELLDAALGSLRDHDPKRSLLLLARHAELYPRGMLATERRGLRVLALCAVGDRERAVRERSAYLSSAAHTPLAERVRRTCRPEGEP
jgi:hypothetical protein